MSGVKHIILVLSGKGGVGKSTVASQLAYTLNQCGKKVGMLDVDLCGPSAPKLFNVQGSSMYQCSQGWVPVYIDKEQTLGVVSIGFLLNSPDAPVVWRGPKKNGMIQQFVQNVYWGELDYLIIDTPPGTSDEHISVVEQLRSLQPDGVILVTTPQGVAVGDVRRELTFCKKTGLPILGIVENMSGFVCPTCSECTNIFSKGGGKSLAEMFNIPFLGAVPLDPTLTTSMEKGENFVVQHPTSPAVVAIISIAEAVING